MNINPNLKSKYDYKTNTNDKAHNNITRIQNLN